MCLQILIFFADLTYVSEFNTINSATFATQTDALKLLLLYGIFKLFCKTCNDISVHTICFPGTSLMAGFKRKGDVGIRWRMIEQPMPRQNVIGLRTRVAASSTYTVRLKGFCQDNNDVFTGRRPRICNNNVDEKCVSWDECVFNAMEYEKKKLCNLNKLIFEAKHFCWYLTL